MRTFLIAVFHSKNAKNHFISDIVEAENERDAENKLIGKKYFYDYAQTRILGTCRKAEIVNEI